MQYSGRGLGIERNREISAMDALSDAMAVVFALPALRCFAEHHTYELL